VRRYCELAERHGMRVQDGPSSLTDERLTLDGGVYKKRV
jgi:hypothetical protein